MSKERLFTKEDMLQFQQDVDFYSNTEFNKKYASTLSRPKMIEKWFEEFELKNPTEKILINEIYMKIMNVYDNPNLSWKNKYNLIFSDELSISLSKFLPFEYYDPDMDYEDDVNAYIDALKYKIEEFNK